MPRPPKIAYLVKTFPKLSETFILNEVRGLEKLGMELEIFSLRSPSGEPVHASVAEVKANVMYVPDRVVHGMPPPLACRILLGHLFFGLTRPLAYLRTALAYQRQRGEKWRKDFFHAVFVAFSLRLGKFDHLHAHFANLPASVAEMVHDLSGIPFSFTAHAKDIYLTDPAELKRKMAGAACVLTCTAYNQKHLEALSPGPTPIHLAYHGVDMARFESAGASRASADAPPSVNTAEPLILSVGRLCEKKGFPFLIRACRILKDRGFRFQCRIVGSGELRGELEALIAELDIARCVSLSGQMVQDEVFALYRSASVFVLPCLITDNGDRDGIPNVLMEAMVSNIPVISTPISGITELVDHLVDGLLIPERDTPAIADAIALLLVQPELRRTLAENGRAKVLERFVLEASARRVHQLLLQTIAPARRPGELSETPNRAAAHVARPVTIGLPAGRQRGTNG